MNKGRVEGHEFRFGDVWVTRKSKGRLGED